MTMIIALATGSVALVAADCRYTYEDGVYFDWGQKIRRVPGGWTVGGGRAAPVLAAQRAVEGTGLFDVELARASSVNAIRSAAAAAGLTSFFAYVFGARLHDGVPWVHSLEVEDGEDWSSREYGAWFLRHLESWAPGMSGAQRKHALDFLYNDADPMHLGKPPSLPQVLRAVGKALAYSYVCGHGVSPEVEVGFDLASGAGVQTGYLRCRADWLGSATDIELEAAVTEPPVLPPFPHAPCESRTFTVLYS